jgi:hypothetical protein
MADHTPNNLQPDPQQPTQLPDGLSDAARVRAFADAEMSSKPSSESGVAFEQNLRVAVGRVMSEPQAAPADLRAKILARFDAEYADQPISFEQRAVESKQQSPRPSGGLRALLPRFAALAAVLLLSGAAIFLGSRQFAPSNNGQLAVAEGLSIQTVSSQLQFVQREHSRCSDITSGIFTSKIEATEPDEARAFAEARLGCGGARLEVAIAKMVESGYRFIGVGACAVPGGGKSVHALFTPADATSALRPVSVFLLESPGEGCKDAMPGVCYSCPKAKDAGKPSMLWRDQNLIVFVHSESVQSVDIARDAYMAPDAIQSL